MGLNYLLHPHSHSTDHLCKSTSFFQWSSPSWGNLCHSAERTLLMFAAALGGCHASLTSMHWLIFESLNHLHFKRAPISSPTINPTLQSSPSHHVPKCHIYSSFKYFQAWWLNHLLGEMPVCQVLPQRDISNWFCITCQNSLGIKDQR